MNQICYYHSFIALAPLRPILRVVLYKSWCYTCKTRDRPSCAYPSLPNIESFESYKSHCGTQTVNNCSLQLSTRQKKHHPVHSTTIQTAQNTPFVQDCRESWQGPSSSTSPNFLLAFEMQTGILSINMTAVLSLQFFKTLAVRTVQSYHIVKCFPEESLNTLIKPVAWLHLAGSSLLLHH